jgi:phosphohistidine phosphatase
VNVYLVHHGEAVGPDIDPARPLSDRGRQACERLARAAAARETKPAVVWHSGKLRAKQSAEIFWRECNALAAFSATRDLQPDDQALWMRDRLRHESADIMLIGHFPHLPRLHALLLGVVDLAISFPLHGIVALSTRDDGESWMEEWRMESERQERRG